MFSDSDSKLSIIIFMLLPFLPSWIVIKFYGISFWYMILLYPIFFALIYIVIGTFVETQLKK